MTQLKERNIVTKCCACGDVVRDDLWAECLCGFKGCSDCFMAHDCGEYENLEGGREKPVLNHEGTKDTKRKELRKCF